VQVRRLFVSVRSLAVLLAALLFATVCLGQSKPSTQPVPPGMEELNKYPGLMEEFGHLFDKFQREIQFPPQRNTSSLLPLLPESTVFVAASSNYGDVLHQAMAIFQQELQTSAVLRDWWLHSDVSKSAPDIERLTQKLYEASQYLGDEVILSASVREKEPVPLLVAEIRKPGLKEFLQGVLRDLPAQSHPPVRLLDVAELAGLRSQRPMQDLLILVRPDYLVIGGDAAALREFNTRIDKQSAEFASTTFGQRLAQAYDGGVSGLAGADLQKIISYIPVKTAADRSMLQMFQRTGLADVKYLVWEHKTVDGRRLSQSELIFTGPRRGIAAWLGQPTALGGLSFVSPKPMMAFTVSLANPAQIYDDIRELATASSPNAFAGIEQGEQAVHVSLRDDVLAQLSGEVTLELDHADAKSAVWRAILRVNDTDHLQQALSTLLASTHAPAEEFVDHGRTYHAVQIPSGTTTTEIAYTFVDNYLVIGSSRATTTEAVRLHKAGEGLAASRKFLDALPPGHPATASLLWYQDPVAMTAMQLRQIAPQLADSVGKSASQASPFIACAYAERDAIHSVSSSAGLDAGAIAVVAAIAIPNLMHAKVAANESTAVGKVRSVVTAETSYAAANPQGGFANDLATLGQASGSSSGAGLTDASLGCSGAWCTSNGFRFHLSAICAFSECKDFLIVATPVNAGSGARNLCSTSDGIIHAQPGPPLTSPPSIAQCKRWPPLK